MAERKWWQWILFFTKVAGEAAAEGEIGSGKKTEKLGRAVSGASDALSKELNKEDK